MYVSSDDPHDEPVKKQQKFLPENETPHATQTSKHFQSMIQHQYQFYYFIKPSKIK